MLIILKSLTTVNALSINFDLPKTFPLTFFDEGNSIVESASCSVIKKDGTLGRVKLHFLEDQNVNKETLEKASFYWDPENNRYTGTIRPAASSQTPLDLLYIKDSHGNPIAEANLDNTFIKINKGEEKISNVVK